MPLREFVCADNAAHDEPVHFERRFATHGDYTEAYSLGMIACPKCGNVTPTPVVSQTARPQFKGSGFYETEYKK